MSHTAIPDDELKVFASLTKMRVVFDVGSRDDVDYLIIKPNIKLHIFEPNPVFLDELKTNLKGRDKNVTINEYGLGNREGRFAYSAGSETFTKPDEKGILVRRLDDYVEEKGIKYIDFLKIDTEGWDYKVLEGASKTIPLCRYIQYEHWDNDADFHRLLSGRFDMYYIGGRSTICVRKGEKKPWIPPEPQEGGLVPKSEKNYFNTKLHV
jgi:FkbM family methyltransferase